MFGLNMRQLFMLLLLIGALFAGAQYVPAYFNAIQFNDFIRQEVRFAVSSRKSADDIRRNIVSKAIEMNIPVAPRDIRITRRGPAFTLDLQYQIPIDLRVYQHDLTFDVSESGELFDR